MTDSTETTVPDPFGGNNTNQCVGLLQKPGCGTEPVLSGDRGGSMQTAVFGILIAAMVFIGVRVARAVINGDRARNKAAGINE
jgi:hypothetical protein